MALLEGKTPTERNKIIAAAMLGIVALIALYLAFGRSSSSSATTATVKGTPTPRSNTSPASERAEVTMPPLAEQELTYQSMPVVYQPGAYGPDAGRNIFAFYEPPPPCVRDCPTPVPPPIPIKTAPPLVPPPFDLTGVNPQTVYAGSRGFRLEVTGARFSPDSHIYFSQSELPTTFINENKLVADIPANFIAQEGPRSIIIQTPDGKKYSSQMMMSVMAPPKPSVQYIGMIGRKRYNNDTAYFTESEKSTPFGARLNDVLGNRFRLVSIAPAEVTFQDVDLGFKHRIPISRQAALGTAGGGFPSKGGSGTSNDGGFVPFDPASVPAGDIPGIPNNIQRYNPSQPSTQPMMEAAPQKKPEKKDVDDNGDEDGE